MEDLFGKRLKALRLTRNLKQDELAQKLDISKSLIGMYERGHRSPSREMLQELSSFFNVSSDYLLGFTENPEPSRNPDRVLTDLDEFLEQSSVMFKGKLLSPEEKKRIQDVLTALFWESYEKK